jgi:hypothetical protein
MLVLFNNLRSVGMMKDKLAGLFGNMNRYHKSNEESMWLSLYNADSFSFNRKPSAEFYVAYPFITIIGGIQPSILKKVFAGDMRRYGMADRSLYVYDPGLRKEILGDE